MGFRIRRGRRVGGRRSFSALTSAIAGAVGKARLAACTGTHTHARLRGARGAEQRSWLVFGGSSPLRLRGERLQQVIFIEERGPSSPAFDDGFTRALLSFSGLDAGKMTPIAGAKHVVRRVAADITDVRQTRCQAGLTAEVIALLAEVPVLDPLRGAGGENAGCTSKRGLSEASGELEAVFQQSACIVTKQVGFRQ